MMQALKLRAGLSLLTIALAVLYVPGIASAAHAPRWWLVIIGSPLVLMLAPRITWTLGHTLGCVFLLGAAVSWFWSFSPFDTVYQLVLLLGLACAFGAGAEAGDLKAVWLGLAYGLAPSCVLSIFQIYGYKLGLPSNAVDGLFLNRNTYALLGAVALVGLITTRQTYGYPLLFAGWSALAPCSRSVWLTLGALALLSWLRSKTWVFRLQAISFFLFVAAGLLYWDGFDPERWGSMYYRLQFIEWTLVNLRPEGWGWGAYDEVFKFGNAHLDMLEVAFELGLLAWPLFALVVVAWGSGLGPERAVLFTLLLASCFNPQLHTPLAAFLAAVVLGRMCAERERLRLSRPARRASNGVDASGGSYAGAAGGL